MRFRDIPQVPQARWQVDIEWGYLEEHIAGHEAYPGPLALDLNPDLQREHVWTMAQRVAYVEYVLRGGEVGKSLFFNCPGWQEDDRGPYVILDGKQRLESVRMFLRGEVEIFSGLPDEGGETRPRAFADFTDSMRMFEARFSWRILKLDRPKEILRFYLSINTGGTPHTDAEIMRVRLMLAEEVAKDPD